MGTKRSVHFVYVHCIPQHMCPKSSIGNRERTLRRSDLKRGTEAH